MRNGSWLESLERLLESRWSQRAWGAAMALVVLVTLHALLRSGSPPLGAYDEALLLVDGELLHRGQVMFRDFSANYPPGIYQIMRVIVASGWPAIWTMRWFGFFVRVLAAVLAARLAGRAQGKQWCWVTGTSVLALQCGLWLVPYAYNVAIIQVMLVFLAWIDAPHHRWARLASGVMLGLLSYVRIDVCIYLGLFLAAMEGVSWVAWRRAFLFHQVKAYVETLGVALLVALVLWAPVVYQAGFARVVHDLVLDVSRLAMPSRLLPFPHLMEWAWVGNLGLSLPMIALKKGSLTYLVWLVTLTLSATSLGVMFWRRELTAGSKRAVWLLLVGTLVTIPAATGRSDYPHIVYGAPFFIALAASVASSRVKSWGAPLLVLFSAGFALRAGSEFAQPAAWFLTPRSDEHFRRQELTMIAQLVQSEIPPDEPIFVGCDSHARHIISPLDVYYFAHRPGATRYMQFDPGLTTSAPVHHEMIADLEYSRPRLFIQHRACTWFEPNASQQMGSPLLDEYLAQRYFPAYGLPSFVIWRRRETSDIGFARNQVE